jgi:hypothetical protein
MVWDCWQAPEDSVSHDLWKERLGGVPNFIKEHVNALFNNSEPLSTCLVWKITRTLLPFVDRNNHLPKQFLSLFYKWKALAHDKFLLPSAEGLSFLLLCWVNKPIPLYLKQAFELLWSNHPYVDLFNHAFYFSLFSTMLLSEWIYLWKLSMTVKRLLWLSMWFLQYKL